MKDNISKKLINVQISFVKRFVTEDISFFLTLYGSNSGFNIRIGMFYSPTTEG